nr:retrovirus-related Pol polyprotein from transposon TNT 1-94 [Tanacetum cinerariifolium]
MPNPEDITDSTTAMKMALALMAKAFKLNYSTPTNNNQRISSNPRNRQIAQSGMNMGQDRQMQMVGGTVQNVRNQVAQNPRVQNVGHQNGLIGVQGNGNQNQIGNGNLVAVRAKGNAAWHNGNQIRCLNFVNHDVIQICLRCVDSGCSKHMTGNLKLLINFVWKFLGTVCFENDHVAAILGFGDLQWGNILITRVYFVEGLGHNLFSVFRSLSITKKIMETMNVSFNELLAMAFKQRGSKPGLQCMYDDYFGGQPSATVENIPPAQEPQVRQTSTASTTIADTVPIPTN